MCAKCVPTTEDEQMRAGWSPVSRTDRYVCSNAKMQLNYASIRLNHANKYAKTTEKYVILTPK